MVNNFSNLQIQGVSRLQDHHDRRHVEVKNEPRGPSRFWPLCRVAVGASGQAPIRFGAANRAK
jgi:hypothetical protein